MGDRHPLRHRRRPSGRLPDRDHDFPCGVICAGFAQTDRSLRHRTRRDLARRDFTINAMAVRLPTGELDDPFGGMPDLVAGLLRTPGPPEVSFGDDPLRMLRAARFVSQLGVRIEPATLAAIGDMALRLEIVSAERVRDELVKLILGPHAADGVWVMVDTGLADIVLPEVPALSLEIDEHRRHKGRLSALADGVGAGDRAGDLPRPRPGAGFHAAVRGAVARHRQAAHVASPPTASRSTITRSSGPDDPQADAGFALQQRAGRRGLAAGGTSPALPRLRRR